MYPETTIVTSSTDMVATNLPKGMNICRHKQPFKEGMRKRKRKGDHEENQTWIKAKTMSTNRETIRKGPRKLKSWPLAGAQNV